MAADRSLVDDRYVLVPDRTHEGRREAWYCACPNGYSHTLRPWRMDVCEVCRVAAPWLTWEAVNAY